MGEREEVETLVERSSLGTPDAAAARAGVSDEDAERVMARVRELERVEPLAEQMCAWRGGRWDFIRPEVRERYRSLAAGVLASSWLAAHDERVSRATPSTVVAVLRAGVVYHHGRKGSHEREGCGVGMSIECASKIKAPEGQRNLQAGDIREWFSGIPDGANLHAISQDFGNQRDPEVHMVGIRATWSEDR